MENFTRLFQNEAFCGLLGTVIGAFIGALAMWLTNRNKIKNERINLKTQIEADREKILETIENENTNLLRKLQNDITENNKNRIAEHQTDRRIEWMYMVREELANYIAICMAIKEKCIPNKEHKESIPDSMIFQQNKSIAKLKLLFNFCGKKDKEILKLIDCITKNISSGDIEYFKESNVPNLTNQIEILTKLTQVYLKLEWTRIKLEAKGEEENIIKDELIEREKKLNKECDIN